MKRVIITTGFALVYMLYMRNVANAQDLEPRAYVRVPVKANVISPGITFSNGGVLTDPTLPLKDLKANIQAVSLLYVRSFNLFGLTAQAAAGVPFGWVHATALVDGQLQTANRSGFFDMRFRVSVLLLGAPAITISELMKKPPSRHTILGTSVSIVAPTGQFFSNKLINLGANRWSFRPELAVSQPLRKRWLLDVYAGVWFFTKNTSFYPGNSIRKQHPLGTFQAHASYTIKHNMWAAIDATFYAGGSSELNGVLKDDRTSNTRLGGTLLLPVSKRSGLKIACSTGAIVRAGANFTIVSVGWSYLWF